MIEKLDLSFPLLSDPDRSRAVEPYGVDDPKDSRLIARPALFLVAPDSSVAFSVVSTDFADRSHEDEVIEFLGGLGLPPTEREAIDLGPARAGPNAMPLHALEPYYRGAKFAGVALRMRHPEFADEFDRYVDQMDRYLSLAKGLRSHE